MIDKTVTTRKPHQCNRCGGTIPARSKAHFTQFRTSHQGHALYVTMWNCIGECIQDRLDREARLAEYEAAAQSDAEPQQPCPHCGLTYIHRHDCMSYFVN